MKVLYYNWCPPTEKQGGGIVVYQNNIFSEVEKKPDWDVFFLNSGFYYDEKKETYVRQENDYLGAKIFSIVNSPIVAPIQSPIKNIARMIKCKKLDEFFWDFVRKCGGFDVIHFQTLEGLSFEVLKIKELFPKTRIVLSLHNYSLFCPNVQLWTNDEKNCYVCKNTNCGECMKKYNTPSEKYIKHSRIYAYTGKRFLYTGTRAFTAARRMTTIGNTWDDAFANKVLKKYRSVGVKSVNKYCDIVLAVSERVKKIAIDYGVDKSLIISSYIGTKVAENAIYGNRERINKDTFGIVYMGYMRKEKGFSFFVDALEKVDTNISRNIDVTFASKIRSPLGLVRVLLLKRKYRSVTIINGYSHDDFESIVSSCELGVVPVLWEDNLPQVAVEMIAYGLPVLASDLGGAHELNSMREFTFSGGNVNEFKNKIVNIFHNRELLDEYWKYSKKLVSMKEHIGALERVYMNNSLKK